MQKKVLFGFALLCGVFLTNVMAAEPSVDPATYAPRGANGEFTLASKWLYSAKRLNYKVAADLIAPANTARGMALKDGKMLFIDRSNKRIVVVNGTTGVKEAPVNLASNLFTYMGRNKANTADSLWTAGLWGFQDSFDMLNKVKLFVACGCPEVLTVVGQVLSFLFTLLVGECHTALFSKRRVGQYIVIS